MDGRLWAKHFLESAESLAKIAYPEDSYKDKAWTEFLGRVVEQVAEKMGCYPAMRRKEAKKDQYSGEYLNIDAMFFDLKSYDLLEPSENWDPFVLPQQAVELENSYRRDKIAYCLWKLFCIRVPLRVLVCYQDGQSKVQALKKHLTEVIKKGGLAEGDGGQLLVLIGDDSLGETATWKQYYSFLEWQGGKLEPFLVR
jgi:hypothetical protein